MDGLITAFTILCATPMLVFSMQLASNRLLKALKIKMSNQVVVILCSVAGHVPVGAIIWIMYLRDINSTAELVLASVYCLAVYNALAYSYFHLFNMSETARRIRILYEIYAAGGAMSPAQMSSYGAQAMLKNRIERLTAMKQIKRNGSRYYLDHRLIYAVSTAVAGWGSLLGIPYPEMSEFGSGRKTRLTQAVREQDAKQDAA